MEGGPPLVPDDEVSGEVCEDVRPVLREVFRELDVLPPLVSKEAGMNETDEGGNHSQCTRTLGNWFDKYSSNCKEIWDHEEELKLQFAKRLSKDPSPNNYKLYPKQKLKEDALWKKERKILQRKDLMPQIQQNAGREHSLWIKNTLNSSSGDVSSIKERGSRIELPGELKNIESFTLQSVSVGEVVVRSALLPVPVPQAPLLPEYILCVPPILNFVNFMVGQLYTQTLRLVNVSKFEMRLSIRPPKQAEFEIELCSGRGLTVTSGAAAELKVHFRSRDVRPVRDVLVVNVSAGRSLTVPIRCYMEPPLLEISLVNVLSSSASWGSGGKGPLVVQPWGSDVLDLGARLLGDPHHATLLLRCSTAHASFFILTEDAWLSYTVNELTWCGSVIAETFVVQPAWWRGAAVRGAVWCRAPSPGLHFIALRVLCSTAVTRPLQFVADALYFKPHHVTIQAHEKDFDICAEEDPGCEYYVHLGTAFPHRSLSAPIKIINHSPVTYNYYWSVRPWGVCSCWEEDLAQGEPMPEEGTDRSCSGAIISRSRITGNVVPSLAGAAMAMRMEPQSGCLPPQSTATAYVSLPDVGEHLHTRRAVFMLVLKNIPKESFGSDLFPMIVNTKRIEADAIPGLERWSRDVCDTVCAQLEVWWDVAPVRFAVDPPVIVLPYSRRVKTVDLQLRATQLFGFESVKAEWEGPSRIVLPESPILKPTSSLETSVHFTLPDLPNEYPETEIITLSALEDTWKASCVVQRHSSYRHPRLHPAVRWLGVVPPAARLRAQLSVTNDTHQHIYWWGEPYRWWRENEPSAACVGRGPCATCRQPACACASLRPTRGALHRDHQQYLLYDVNAPDSDGCVATLIQVRRSSADVARVPSGAGTEARASLVAYRVLAPRLVLRILPCIGEENCKESCDLDLGSQQSSFGSGVLRPTRSLTLGRRSCCRLRVRNVSPVATAVQWEPADDDNILRVVFIPNRFDIAGHREKEIRVILEAKKISGRRVFVRRARAAHAYKPVYLVIDAAVSGIEVTCQLPLGCDPHSDFVEIRRSQKEEFPWEAHGLRRDRSHQIFEANDAEQKILQKNLCKCRFELVYIPAQKPAMRPPEPSVESEDMGGEGHQKNDIEFLTTPPSLARVCPCCGLERPRLPERAEPLCLQFKETPIRTVVARRVVVRNLSPLAGRWRAAVRRHPRRPRPLALRAPDAWASEVGEPGVAIEWSMSRGVLGPHAELPLLLQVYADCWGLYHDQVLIEIENLEPIIVDVWIEVVGPPLTFALKPADRCDDPPTLWVSSSDAAHALRATNTSRAPLAVHAYVLTKNDYIQDWVPFRVYIRLFDVPLPAWACPCAAATHGVSNSAASDVEGGTSDTDLSDNSGTGIELFIAPDFGHQDGTFFKVEPEECFIEAGAHVDWNVTLKSCLDAYIAPPTVVLFRIIPSENFGEGWCRPEPQPQTVRLGHAARAGLLQLSRRCLTVNVCALHLVIGDIMRIRKRVRVLNVGNGELNVTCRTESPWSIVGGLRHMEYCGAGCCCRYAKDEEKHVTRDQAISLHLKPTSSTEICLEVRLVTDDVWPPLDDKTELNYDHRIETISDINSKKESREETYPENRVVQQTLYFHDEFCILRKVPLILDIHYPKLKIEPSVLSLGFVTHGETRKMFFTISHSSHNETIHVITSWKGPDGFRIWPSRLLLLPRSAMRLYVEYTASWSGGVVEGSVWVHALGGAWCRRRARVLAVPTRDHAPRRPQHDHTDRDHPPSKTLLT